jgi:hypothetical protein
MAETWEFKAQTATALIGYGFQPYRKSRRRSTVRLKAAPFQSSAVKY